MSKEDLLDSIEELYGFKREQIKNPELCGCFHVDFEVNGILYSGSVAFHGAVPQLWRDIQQNIIMHMVHL